MLFAVRQQNESQHRFPVEGVESTHTYRLHFSDHSAPDRTISGRELLKGA